MDRCSLWSILFSQGWCLWAWLRPAYTKLASGARDKCRYADIQRGYSHYLATSFGASHLSYIDQNRIMWLSVDVGQNISQGQSVAQSIIPVHLLYSIRHHWYSTGNLCALGIWKLKSPPPSSIIQTRELQNIDISLYSENVMDNDQAVHQKMFPQKPRFWVKM